MAETYEERLAQKMSAMRWHKLHLDPFLFFCLLLLAGVGLFILYSASNADNTLVTQQAVRFGISLVLLCIFAQIPPKRYQQWAPWFFLISFLLLLAVPFIGKTGMGGKRWLSLGLFNFQPSELMKLAMPAMLASYLGAKGLPPRFLSLLLAFAMIAAPAVLIAKQPDLGTAIVVVASGFFVVLLSGIRWRWLGLLAAGGIALTPLLWHFMHTYQRNRVLTFLNPGRDPLGNGYHIIQSKIAIGSGGLLGKGYLQGTQSHLSFLPAHTTDFIFAVAGEELGLIGCLGILTLFLIIFCRCWYISANAQDNFSRLFAGSLSLTFIASVFINLGMVAGILPVVGVPLPLISYGGSTMLTFMISFGMLMSIHTHRRLWSS